MDFDKLQQDVEQLEKKAQTIQSKPEGGVMREFASGLRDVLYVFLKDRKEQIRPGQICKDAAAKNLIPGDGAARAAGLLTRWTGSVTPQDPQAIKDDAAKFTAVAAKILPVLKSYQKQK